MNNQKAALIISRIKIGTKPLFAKQYSENKLSLMLFLASSVWGLYWVPLRLIEGYGVQGSWSVALFNGLPMIVLLPILALQKRSQWHTLGPATVAAIFAGLGLALYATGLVTTSIVRTTLLFYLAPVWGTIVGMIWLGERLTSGRIVAIVLGLVGLLLLLQQSDANHHPFNIGDICALLSGLSWSIAAATLKRWPTSPVIYASTVQFGVSMLAGVAIALFVVPQVAPTPSQLLAALPVATFASVFVLAPTVLLIFWITKQLFPGRVGILMMSEALVAIVSAAIFLPEEVMNTTQWIGAAAIVGAALTEVRASQS
jgi:drug/metabolite transporter (DMT)-like permease